MGAVLCSVALAAGCRGEPSKGPAAEVAEPAPPTTPSTSKGGEAPVALECPMAMLFEGVPYPGAVRIPEAAAYTSLNPGMNIGSETYRAPAPSTDVLAYFERCLPGQAPSPEGEWKTFSLAVAPDTLAKFPKARRTLAVRADGAQTLIRVTCVGCG
jgi:hypothetical protein